MAEQYCIYLRKSRKDDDTSHQGESIEETLARHERTLRDLAKSKNLPVSEDAIYREVVSGDSIDSRPVMTQLLDEVEDEKWTGVIVMEVERLARGDTKDQGTVAQAFKYSETLIITPNKTYDPTNEHDEEYFEFGLFMSRRELKTITRRLQRGRLAAVKEGLYVANKPPYGYERIPVEGKKGWTLKAIPKESEVIEMIFELYTTGELQSDNTYKRLGVSLIARRLNMLKKPTRTGGIWVSSSVRDILINPVYIGKVRWNWRPVKKTKKDKKSKKWSIERPRAKDDAWTLADGLHEGIIDPEVFALAQEYMKQNKARPIGERSVVKNPLAGLVICGMCGRRMVRRPYGKTGYPDTLMCAVPECPNVSSHLHLVEAKILEALEILLEGYKLQWNIDTKPKKPKNSMLENKRNALIEHEKDFIQLQTELSNAYKLVERGVYTDEEFIQRRLKINEDIKQAEDFIKDLKEQIKIEETREVNLTVIIPTVEKVIDTYHALQTAQAKNDLLKEVLEKVVYTKEKGGRWHNSPDDFDIEISPKLPSSLKS